jgi:uncharacterized repeat protein (TIGR01451 family)
MTPSTRRTGRWQVGLLVALLAAGLGILGGNTVLFMASAVGLTFAAYGYATAAPAASFVVSRTVDDDSPRAGQPVEVTVTVRNASESIAPDLRVVDGVPEKLGVVEGSPRHATALQPGESTSFTYTVRARRGRHEFGDATVVSRDLSASAGTRSTTGSATRLTVVADVGSVPLSDQTIPQTGFVSTDVGGNGVEFYQSREYHTSDPINRVDWKRYARTRELTTVEFREERAATVVIVVDVRRVARVARRGDEPDGVVLGRFAASRLANALLDDGNRVGVALYGTDAAFLDPGAGDAHAVRVRDALADDSGTSPVVADGGPSGSDTGTGVERDEAGVGDGQTDLGGGEVGVGGGAATGLGARVDRSWTAGGHGGMRPHDADGRVAWLRRRLPESAQLYVISPLVDDEPGEVARRLRASGHDVRILAPDVTSTRSPGATIERIEWLDRVSRVRGSGVKVAAWSPDEPLLTAFQRARRRWDP